MTDRGRQLESAARRMADQQSARIAEAAMPDKFIATVSGVTPGSAQDGNSVVSVTYRGTSITAAGWNLSQTFAVGQRVMCSRASNQVFVDYVIGGQP